jgi:hypothetical protein
MAALVCLLCLQLVAPLLAQGARPSRKLLWTAQEEPSHGGLGGHDTGAATTPTPVSISLKSEPSFQQAMRAAGITLSEIDLSACLTSR